MANYKEEHIRNSRRLARQMVGAAALLLAFIGLFTVLGWIVGLVRAALDDSDLRQKYKKNILNGGKFFLRKGNYDAAYGFMDAYYTYTTNKRDTMLPKLA